MWKNRIILIVYWAFLESGVTFSQGPAQASYEWQYNLYNTGTRQHGETTVQELVLAATKADAQTVFPFVRMKCSTYQNTTQLNRCSWGEILVDVNGPKFCFLQRYQRGRWCQGARPI